MSMSHAQPQTGQCRHCGDEHPIETAVGQFCSTDCRYRAKGEKALRVVRNDHRFCGTCGGVLKEISSPNDEWVNEQGSPVQVALNNGAEYRNIEGEATLDLTDCGDTRRTAVEAVCGFQYQTEDAELVLREREGPNEYSRLLETATGCTCGTTDHTDTADILRECDPVRVLSNYVTTFRLLERNGPITKRIDKTVFFETYRETQDFELALGRALYG